MHASLGLGVCFQLKKFHSFWCRYPEQAVQHMGRFSLSIDWKVYHPKLWFVICSQKKKLDWKFPVKQRLEILVKQWLEISTLILYKQNTINAWQEMSNQLNSTVKNPNNEQRKPTLIKIEEVFGKIKWTSSEIWPHCERWKAQQHSKTLVNAAILWPHKDKTLKFVV